MHPQTIAAIFKGKSQTTLRLRQQFQGQVPRRIRQKHAALRRK